MFSDKVDYFQLLLERRDPLHFLPQRLVLGRDLGQVFGHGRSGPLQGARQILNERRPQHNLTTPTSHTHSSPYLHVGQLSLPLLQQGLEVLQGRGRAHFGVGAEEGDIRGALHSVVLVALRRRPLQILTLYGKKKGGKI